LAELEAKCDAGSLVIGIFVQIFRFRPKDGSTTASTSTGTIFILSGIQLLINNHLEYINIIFIKVSTDKCIKHNLNSIRAKMAELESIENLDILYTLNRMLTLIKVAKALDPHASVISVPQALAVPHASVLHANAIADARDRKSGLMDISVIFIR
jgi:hypothetical protein